MAALPMRWRRRQAESEPEPESPDVRSSTQVGSLLFSPLLIGAKSFGLFPLNNDTTNDGQNIDIVAVHGLTGHWKRTWTADNGKLWLRDFLPQQLREAGTSARIMSYGYDANLRFGGGVTTINDQAENLIFRLNLERRSDEEKKRPALIHAWENADAYQDLLESIQAAVFFGVPHGGADTAYWADVPIRILNYALVGYDINNSYLDALRRDSTVWRDISRSFVKRATPLKIRTFYETRKVQNVLVVDRESAVMGLPNERAVMVDADHRDMCKFPNAESQTYRPVWKAIVQLAEEITDRPVPYQLSEEEKKCLHALYQSHYQQHKARNPSRADGTCTWFLEHPRYEAWKSAEKSALLWVSADAGCGKSVLASFLVDELGSMASKASIPGTVCYFFFKDDNDDQRNALSALRAVLHQLLSAQHHLVSYAMPDFTNMGEKFKDDFLTLWHIFTTIATNIKDGNIICVLDALDECDDSTRNQFTQKLVGFFKSPPAGSRLKVVVTSRPNRSIEEELDGDKTIRIKGEDNDISPDIELVVKHEVQEIGRKRKLNGATQARIVESLISNADRTFLWVSLILDMIKDHARTSETVLNSLINSIPPSLDAVYEKILGQSRKSADVKKVLCIIVAAARPLTLDEMNVAFSLEISQQPDHEPDLEPSIEHTLLALCGPFLRFKDSRVYLVHQTAKEFLLGELGKGGSWKRSISPVEAHGVLAETCMSYLSIPHSQGDPVLLRQIGRATGWPNWDDFRSRYRYVIESYKSRFLFLSYAAENWAAHVEQCRNDSMAAWSLKLCNVESQHFQTWFAVYSQKPMFGHPVPTSGSDIVFSSFFGHLAAVQLHVKTGAHVDTRDGNLRTALHWAVERGHESMVEFLLSKSADVDAKDKGGNTPLRLAVVTDSANIAQLLIRKGADIEAKSKSSMTALHWAALLGREAVVELLLQKGASFEARDQNGQTALHQAAQSGREAVVELLLQKGASIEARDQSGRTALHWATKIRCEAIVQLLLQKGASIEARDERSMIALHWATKMRFKAVVQLLLQRGASIEARDERGMTALHWAALSESEPVLQLLLQNKANTEARDNQGRTALHWAAQETLKAVWQLAPQEEASTEAAANMDGTTSSRWRAEDRSKAVVRLLLQEGTSIEARDERGMTALHRAVEEGCEAVVKLLLQKGASVEASCKDGMTALHWAAWQKRSVWVVFLLLKRNADVGTRDRIGRTPLHLAAETGSIQVIKLLLEKNADAGAEDDSGQTPLDVAIQWRNLDAEGLLRRQLENSARRAPLLSPSDISTAGETISGTADAETGLTAAEAESSISATGSSLRG